MLISSTTFYACEDTDTMVPPFSRMREFRVLEVTCPSSKRTSLTKTNKLVSCGFKTQFTFDCCQQSSISKNILFPLSSSSHSPHHQLTHFLVIFKAWLLAWWLDYLFKCSHKKQEFGFPWQGGICGKFILLSSNFNVTLLKLTIFTSNLATLLYLQNIHIKFGFSLTYFKLRVELWEMRLIMNLD